MKSDINQVRFKARQELQELDSDELINLFLEVADQKTLIVLTTSLKVARKRGERDVVRVRTANRKSAFNKATE